MAFNARLNPTLRTVAIETHGCKLNQADSDSLARQFQEAGFRLVSAEDGPDVYVLNSCTVTHVADAKARRGLRAARRANPLATVVATGCYAQRSPAEVSAVSGVDLVVGNFDKDTLVQQLLQTRGGVTRTINPPSPPVPLSGSLRRTRAMVKIQEGCNQICAYCIVPKVRGRERSIPLDSLVQRVQTCVEEGFKEVVLTGTQLGSYGFDLPGIGLQDLVGSLLRRTTVERLRVSSLQPQEINPELLDLWENPRLCPHFHLPLQSGSDTVLKSMRRRYTADRYRRTVDQLYSSIPHASVTADLIVGFPGEGEAEFEESYQFCRELNLADIHVFPYSARPGTTAAHMDPQPDPIEQKKRTRRMLELASEKAVSFRQQAYGSLRPVLWERPDSRDDHVYFGYTDNYLKVRTTSHEDLTNRITQTRLLNEENGVIKGGLM